MKKLLSLFALVLTVCSTAMAEDLNVGSAVGTIGTLDGRDAMVVDLGGTIGKVAIATMNLGATDVNDYGTQFSSEADFDPASLNLTDGWYVPTIEELSALKDILQPREMTGFEYIVGESVLYFPGFPHQLGGGVMYAGQYLSSNKTDTHYQTMLLYNLNTVTKKIGNFNNNYAPCAIRPFHKLPLKENCRIYYTSSDNNVVTPNNGNFNVSIVSNTYDNGKGVITFSGELTSIGSEAFKQKATLTSVTIPASLKSIGDDAFGGCSKLSSLTFAEGSQLTTIGNRAFKETSITGDLNSLPASLKSIENYAFSQTGIYSVTFPALLENIGDYAFSNCDQLSSFTFAEGSQLIRIGTGAFQGTVISGDLNYLPASLKYIGVSAFNGTQITSVTIPASVISIGEFAFSGCHDLKTLTFAQNSQLETIEDRAFSETIITGQLLLPASLISIGDYAFNETAISGKLTIPASVKSIGGYAFNACSGLTSLTFAEGSQLEMIGSGAFNATAISGELTIPSSVTNIGGAAFDKCPLTKVRMSSVDLSNIEKIIFIGSTVIIVPAELYEAYKSHFGDVNKVETSLTELQEYTIAQIKAAMKTANTISPTDKAAIEGYISTIENATTLDGTLEAYYAALALIDKQKAFEEKVKGVFSTLGTKQDGPTIEVECEDGQTIKLYKIKNVKFGKVKTEE